MQSTDIANRRITCQDVRAQSMRAANFSSILKNRLISLRLRSEALDLLDEQHFQASLSTLEKPASNKNQLVRDEGKLETPGDETAAAVRECREFALSFSAQRLEGRPSGDLSGQMKKRPETTTEMPSGKNASQR